MSSDNTRFTSTTTSRNIVIFGQTWAGKSSIINMLAGGSVAEVSGGAEGCTLSNQPYSIHRGDHSYNFWDTAGLNEAEEGTSPWRTALQNILNLVEDHDVNLLVYCVRNRLVDIIRVNYDLVWKTICRETVPIVLVVTGLEGKDDMEEWWPENQKTIRKMKMSFAGHACITSWKGRENEYERKYKESAEKVWKLVEEHPKPESWRLTPYYSAQARKKVESYFIAQLGVQPSTHSIEHNVILFGEAGSGKSSVVNMIVGELVAKTSNKTEGCTFKNEAYEAAIENITFHIYDTAGLNESDHRRVPHWKAIGELYSLIRQLDGVSLLIYCMRGRMKENAKANWILFHNIICAAKVPVIAIVTGLETYERPNDWWRNEDNRKAFEINKMVPRGVGCVVSFRGERNEYADLYTKSQSTLRRLVVTCHLKRPWSKEKEEWFATIYQNTITSRICPIHRDRLVYSDMMRHAINEFTEETGMKEEDLKKLQDSLLKAEKKLRKTSIFRM